MKFKKLTLCMIALVPLALSGCAQTLDKEAGRLLAGNILAATPEQEYKQLSVAFDSSLDMKYTSGSENLYAEQGSTHQVKASLDFLAKIDLEKYFAQFDLEANASSKASIITSINSNLDLKHSGYLYLQNEVEQEVEKPYIYIVSEPSKTYNKVAPSASLPSFNEDFVKNQIESLKNIPVVSSFIESKVTGLNDEELKDLEFGLNLMIKRVAGEDASVKIDSLVTKYKSKDDASIVTTTHYALTIMIRDFRDTTVTVNEGEVTNEPKMMKIEVNDDATVAFSNNRLVQVSEKISVHSPDFVDLKFAANLNLDYSPFEVVYPNLDEYRYNSDLIPAKFA